MSDADNSSPKTGPNSDNPDLLAKVPDPMTADRDIAEETTDATAADAIKKSDHIERDQHGDPDQVT